MSESVKMIADQQPQLADQFRQAMRELAAAVHVITTGDVNQRSGLTATAVCSLSMEPASILVCVNKSASAMPLLEKSGQFCVNILGQQQSSVADVFAGRTGCEAHERFEEAGSWTPAWDGVEMLDGALANVVCDLTSAVESGTHVICIGQVKEVRLASGSAPLIYSRQGYDTLLSTAQTSAAV
ncbi:flavin reductase family protein [Parendozoicomonas haliclonae]|uniref:4-hydroxyphenylacetate 3-monooxygenase reductase component n=1 Tax=Parendozoicomonas haliclonae TaxID=1960125 RepID=A0A1X7ANW0_9GAMM|nr:flavin reductase family protein [Parendozoicomonas haliclonae]SMA49945.1 4-hydroxyphenylacetate 3-monooxygenase reductase component [Parendozoicomonas haliclonae]